MIIDPGNSGFNKTNGAAASTTKAANLKAPAPAAGVNPNAVGNAAGKAAQDSVSLSSEGRALGKLEQAVSKSADVDIAKVAKIKQAIADGTYKPNSSVIADRMLSQDEEL